MPRRTHAKLLKKRSTDSDRKRSGRPRSPAHDVGEQVVALRETGSSYSAIARTLELQSATGAHQSFVRALETHDSAARRRLADNEEARLDRLEQRIRDRDAPDTEKIERRLRGVANLRKAIGR